jgi:WD40 repeat protein
VNDSLKNWLIVALLVSMFLAGGTSGLHAQDPPGEPNTIDLATLEPITVENAEHLAELSMLGRGTVSRALWSPDGQILALAGGGGIWLYDTGDLKATPRLLSGRATRVIDIAFSSDGALLASSDWNSTVLLWDVASGTLQQRAIHAGIGAKSVALSPDGATLATSGSGNIMLWDVASGTHITTLRLSAVGNYAVYDMVFSPDGTTLAATDQADISLWDVTAREHLFSLKGHTETVMSIAFSPDGSTLASGSADGTARLWDMASGTSLAILDEHTAQVSSVAFSPDGVTLVSGSWDKTIHLWDVASGSSRSSFSYPAAVSSVAFSLDGVTLAVCYGDGAVRLQDVDSGVLDDSLRWHLGDIRSVAFSPDGMTLASGGSANVVYVWDVASGTLRAILKGHTDGVYSVTFSPDGTILASGSWDQTTLLWDVASGTLLRMLEDRDKTAPGPAFFAITFSPDGATLATGGEDAPVRLWDVTSGTLRAVYQLPDRPVKPGVESLAFSADGTMLAVGRAGQILLLEVSSGAVLDTLDTGDIWGASGGDGGETWSLDFSPDGATLAFGTCYGFCLWDVIVGKPDSLCKQNNLVMSVAFSPDGTILASSGGSGFQLWNVASGAHLTKASELFELGTSFSPDGRLLATAGSDGTVRLWGVLKDGRDR